MKLILIHTRNNVCEWLNADLIWRICPYTNQYTPEIRSMIFKSDQQDDYIQVTETPEEIITLIDKAALLAAKVSGEL